MGQVQALGPLLPYSLLLGILGAVGMRLIMFHYQVIVCPCGRVDAV
jgi:hypothetical protein